MAGEGAQQIEALEVKELEVSSKILGAIQGTQDKVRNVLRSIYLMIEPGASAGTNITVTEEPSAGSSFNRPTITGAADLAKSGSIGSFALNGGGTILTMNITENIIGLLGVSISVHDINSSSTTEMYFPLVAISSNNLSISLTKRPGTIPVDLTSVMDAGDAVEMYISFITSS